MPCAPRSPAWPSALRQSKEACSAASPTANVVAGQVVDAREVLFEIIDPSRLRIEALAYDPALPEAIAGANVSLRDGRSYPIEFAGASRALREGALPLQFVAKAGETPLPEMAIGQPVRVVVRTRTRIAGVPVPTTSVVKDPSNQDIVWVHESAERFVPRPVRHMPLDGATVTVVDGLQPGDRVVVQGAPLVNQVR
jgi:membrane fusion protein, heavy metal efflux system